jgi:hypothetical protein
MSDPRITAARLDRRAQRLLERNAAANLGGLGSNRDGHQPATAALIKIT